MEAESDMLQWEYRIVTSKDGLHVVTERAYGEGSVDSLLDDYMTRIGTLGWELVTSYHTDLGYNFVFKRSFPIPAGESGEYQEQ